MVEKLLPSQEAKFNDFVVKWTAIGTCTEPCNVEVTKYWVKEAYKVAKLDPPKNFFYFSSPETSVHAIFMVDNLTNFDKSYTDTTLHSPTDKWLHIFNNLWDQYSKQYDLKKNDGMEWNDQTKARMLSFVSKAYADPDHKKKLEKHLENMLYGAHDAAWLSFYDFFYQEFSRVPVLDLIREFATKQGVDFTAFETKYNEDFVDAPTKPAVKKLAKQYGIKLGKDFDEAFDKLELIECTHDLIPSFEIAKNCGWWSAYGEAAFLQDRPTKIVITEDNVLHCEDGPAITYPDNTEIYCLENFWFPKAVIMDPENIQIVDIESETNAEKRRIMLERFGGTEGNGYLKYFELSNATVLDRDFVTVDPEEKTSMPRMLVETKNKDLWLCGSDGSTRRVYVMAVSNRDRVERRFGEIKTCKQAHQLISGLDESLCVAQS